MMHLEVDKKTFCLYFNEYLFIHHSPEKPLISLGKGDGYYKDSHSAFDIKDKVKSKETPMNFEIIDNSKEKIKISFKFNENRSKISFNFSVKEGKLSIKPEFENDEDIKSYNRFWFKISANTDEAIYGCGEQFSELNLRGLNVPIWVEEQGLGRAVNVKKRASKLYKQKRKFPKLSLIKDRLITGVLNLAAGVGGSWYTTYYPQPTFVSSAQYFCHIDASAYSELNFKNSSYHEIYFWQIPNEIIIGKYESALDVVENVSKFLGIQPELPEWIYDGMILAIQGEGGLQRVEERLNKALDAGVKVNAIWSQDWEGIFVTSFGTQLFWDWKWDGNGREIRFPNFPQFVKDMREKYGVRYFGYINSFFNHGGDQYKEGVEKGYFIKTKDGKPYDVYITTFPVPIVDLTNPEAFEWIKDIIKNNLIKEAGLSGWMSDFGESVPPDSVLYSGEDPEIYHNKFPVEWQRVNYEAVKEAGKLGEIVYFTRSGYSHTSKYSTLIWGGDQLVNWSRDDGLASVIPAALSLGFCGIGYYHTDIGGFTTFKPVFKRSEELFMRWAEQAAFTMVMRTHESNQPLVNPQFDSSDKILSHLGKMSQIHVHLKPYLQKLSKIYQEKGIPPMRALYLHYEKDPEVHSIQYEYLLGKNLLVAPVLLKKKSSWKVYFPNTPNKSDSWIHVWTGKKYVHGWYDVSAPLGKPPIFYLEGCEEEQLFKDIKNFE